MKSKKIVSDLSFVLKNLLAIVTILMIVMVALNLVLPQKEKGVVVEKDKKSDIKPVPVQEKIVIPEVIYNLSGKITKIDGNTIVFNAEIYSVDGKGASSVREEQRSAIVNSGTKLSSLSFVDRSPVDKKIDFSDLKPGDYVEIVSNSDISGAEEFLATRIRVKPSL